MMFIFAWMCMSISNSDIKFVLFMIPLKFWHINIYFLNISSYAYAFSYKSIQFLFKEDIISNCLQKFQPHTHYYGNLMTALTWRADFKFKCIYLEIFINEKRAILIQNVYSSIAFSIFFSVTFFLISVSYQIIGTK